MSPVHEAASSGHAVCTCPTESGLPKQKQYRVQVRPHRELNNSLSGCLLGLSSNRVTWLEAGRMGNSPVPPNLSREGILKGTWTSGLLSRSEFSSQFQAGVWF